MNNAIEFKTYFQLSIQRALLGNVTNNMRAIVAKLSEKKLSCFFIMMVQ